MNVPVLFHRLARPEFVRARRYYAGAGPRVEGDFVAAVLAALNRISANPLAGTISVAPYRWVKAGKFPYLLHYELSLAHGAIIYAVAHGRRKPGYWMRRPHRP